MAIRTSLYLIAALLLGAHFLRAGNPAMAALCASAPLLFLYRKRRSLMLLQLLAYGATVVWVTVALQLFQLRQQSGQPWTAATLILASVALFTFFAGLLLNSRAIRERYPD